MYVRMLESLGTAAGHFRRGEIFEIDSALGNEWVSKQLAAASELPPPWITQFYDRLTRGAGQACLFLPFVGEFGHQIMTHIRMVHWHQAREKVVCCRPGDQVLYPSAGSFITDWEDPIADDQRVGSCRDAAPQFPDLEFAARHLGAVAIDGHRLTPEQELLCIRPGERIPFAPRRRGLAADVLLGVRQREFCPERNWPYWGMVGAALNAAGYSFAVIGHKATSFDVPGQACHSGDYDTDAAIELLQNCRLYIGTDSGNSHLAATVGAQMLCFREVMFGSRDLLPRMLEVNPGRVMRLNGGWSKPDAVVMAAMKMLREQGA